MELHTKQLQICMNIAVAAQLTHPRKCRAIQLVDGRHTAKQKKSLYSGSVAHMKCITSQ